MPEGERGKGVGSLRKSRKSISQSSVWMFSLCVGKGKPEGERTRDHFSTRGDQHFSQLDLREVNIFAITLRERVQTCRVDRLGRTTRGTFLSDSLSVQTNHQPLLLFAMLYGLSCYYTHVFLCSYPERVPKGPYLQAGEGEAPARSTQGHAE